MPDSDDQASKDGSRRMDKAVLINMLTKVNSGASSADHIPPALETTSAPLGEPSAQGDLHVRQVPEAK